MCYYASTLQLLGQQQSLRALRITFSEILYKSGTILRYLYFYSVLCLRNVLRIRILIESTDSIIMYDRTLTASANSV